ncbi:MAG: nicotinamide mononucleotide transporter [Chitinophagaceae bacterium]|nr:nicotinamide mononucleotide transporter [Chitinophagaceae bacterium]
MNTPQWFELLLSQLKQTSLLEWVAVVFGVIQVILAKANKVLLYPAGIIATIASAYVLFDIKLYAEALLNLYYLAMSIYGWSFWSKTKNKPEAPVTFTTRKEWHITLTIALLGWAALYLVLAYLTTSDVPVWDSFVSATAWAGMWLLARRKVENWILLNISNMFAVPLLFYKQLPLFAGLTIFLFIVAVAGYFYWKKIAVRNL